MPDCREFEKWFLSWVQPITEDLLKSGGINKMLAGKEREPLRTATDLAFRTMAEPYLDRNSLSSGRWWLSQLYTKDLEWTGNTYKYSSNGALLQFGPQANPLPGGPLSLPMEIYRLFQAEWPSIVSDARRIYEDTYNSKDLEALEVKLRYLLSGSGEDINKNAKQALSIYTQNLDISVVDAISCEKYEGGSTQCQLAIISDAAKMTPFNANSQLLFAMDNVRALRKQAEMGRDDMCLAISSDGAKMRTRGLIPLDSADCPVISIDQPMHWRFSLPSPPGGQGTRSVQFCRNAFSSFSFPPLDEKMENAFFRQLCQKTFPAQASAGFQGLENVISCLRQNAGKFHGTSILIAAKADKEAMRLCDEKRRGYRLAAGTSATNLLPYLTHLASIDGALLLRPDGECAGFATILDGTAKSQGTPARGARYNSAQTYLDNVKGPALAVVISTDGSIDYLRKKRRGIL